MSGIKEIKKYLKRFIKGYRSDSESYINYLRKKGAKIGSGTVIFGPERVIIDESRPWLLDIGENVQITAGVIILTHDYSWSVLKAVYGEILGASGKVEIGNNVFIGMNSTILKGVKIGENVIIGANSLVTKDIPSNVVVAGNPAKIIMTLDTFYKKRKELQVEEASELVQYYRKRYGKDPDDVALHEFFWLFTDTGSELTPMWKHMMGLMNNKTQTYSKFYENKKIFLNMSDFLGKIK